MFIRKNSKRCHYCGGELFEYFVDLSCDWKEQVIFVRRYLYRRQGERQRELRFTKSRRLLLRYLSSTIGPKNSCKYLSFLARKAAATITNVVISNKDCRTKSLQRMRKEYSHHYYHCSKCHTTSIETIKVGNVY